MADLANLVLAVDSTSVPKATAALDGLTAAGARAEAATVGLGGGFKGSAAGATLMASAAQLSARAAMDQAAGFKASSDAARVNTLAMRETLVVARELSRGNFTRLPGSLTLLAQGVGSQGGFGAYASALANTLGIVKKVQDAELAEAASAAVAAQDAVLAVAKRAAANVIAADTEVALAEAQVRVALGSSAEAAAQLRLEAAHAGVAAAADEAAIAENALGVAIDRANAAQALNAASTRTVIGSGGIGLIGIATAAVGAVVGFEALKQHVADSGVLREYTDGLGLSAQQLDKLKDKTNDFALTFGDVWNGLKQTIADGLDTSSTWQNFKKGAFNAASGLIEVFTQADAFVVGHVNAAYDTIVQQWRKLPEAFGDAFYSAVNVAITALNSLVKKGTDLLNGFIAQANKLPFVSIGSATAPQIGAVGNPYAGAASKLASATAANVKKETDARLTELRRQNAALYNNIVGAAEKRIGDEAPNPPKGKKPRKESDHGLQESLDKLQADIRGQYALAAAYQVSDAAAMRAEAQQKAEEDAIQHKSKAGVFYELELQKAVATRAAEGGKQIADLNAQTAAQNSVNAMVAAGVIPASQMAEQLKIEAELRPLIAAYDNADAAHKAQLAAEIAALTQKQKDYNAAVAQGQALQTIAANDNEIARLKLEASLIGKSNSERAVALAQLQAMQQPGFNQLKPQEQQNLVNSFTQRAQASVLSPFQQWAQSVPQSAAAINEALQSIEVRGFDSLASGIADVITGTKSLGAAFKDIAHQIIGDIIQMTVKMLIFKAISSFFGAPAGSPGVGLLGSANGNVFSGGNVMAFASGGIVGSPTLFPMSGGRTGLMGEAGPEAVMPLARDSSGRLGVRAANNNQSGPIQIEVTVGFGPAPEFAPFVDTVATARAQQAVDVAVKHTNDTVRQAVRPKLN